MIRIWLFVLVGALLLFGLEPLSGKLVLPRYGGSFQVWTTCLMFFQGTLFLSYLYVHYVAPRIGRWHLVIVCLPLVLMAPLEIRGEPNFEWPVASLLRTLTLSVGAPFFVLATSAVLAQHWLAKSSLAERENPYQLYAASNAGSLVALLGYPLLIEPLIGLSAQRWMWSAGYVVYLVLAFLAYRAGRAGQQITPPAVATAVETQEQAAEVTPEGDGEDRWLAWLLLSMIPSAFLMAVTNLLVLDIGSMPLIWVVPLAIYLASFVLTFGRRPFRSRVLSYSWPQIALIGLVLAGGGYGAANLMAMPLHLFVLFTVCMIGHGELYRLRPSPDHLTRFYLAVSLGGWAGGIFVTLIAPLIFTNLLEYPLCVVALGATLLILRWRDFIAWFYSGSRPLVVSSTGFMVIAIGIAVVATVRRAQDNGETLDVHRSFYGLYRVRQYPAMPADAPKGLRPAEVSADWRMLVHGTTIHGAQRRNGKDRGIPVGYYHPPGSPVAQVLAYRVPGVPLRRAAIVGLGAGGLAAFFDRGEWITFYELDPDNEAIARKHFSYLRDAEARGVAVRVVAGDARIQINNDHEQTPDGSLDVLVVDAFSSDAIPTHLLTEEALALYRKKLTERGILVFHISNRFYNLRPVLRATGASLGLPAFFKQRSGNEPDMGDHEVASIWYVISADENLAAYLGQHDWEVESRVNGVPVISKWTDDYANVLAPLQLRFRLN